MRIVFYGKGHPNISAKHKTTLEFTKAKTLSKRGNCIVVIKCEKACKDLPEEFKTLLRKGKKLHIIIECEGLRDELIAQGHEKLELSSEEDIVIRKSDFIDARTLAIRANKAACDLRRELVEKLKNNNTKVKIIMEIL
jgi:hypothetical protein